MFPAFTHVWAARALAHRVQIERAHDALELLVIRSPEILHPQPGRPRMGRGQRRGIVRQYGEGSCHLREFETILRWATL